MRLYRVNKKNDDSADDESQGFTWHSSMKEAQKEKREGGYTEPVEILNVELNKKSLLKFLNAYCDYPDNG